LKSKLLAERVREVIVAAGDGLAQPAHVRLGGEQTEVLERRACELVTQQGRRLGSGPT
jgi:hypothetical protein